MARSRNRWLPIVIALVIALVWYGYRTGWFDPKPAPRNPTTTSTPVVPADSQTASRAAKTHESPHLALGTPADATPDDEHLMLKPQYALSYKAEIVSPAWVAWKVDASSYGVVPRYQGKFKIDTSIPPGLPRAEHNDYTKTGYDRGHLCRSLDRTDTAENNLATFLMSNVLPQTHDLNGGPWLKLEDYCAQLARNFDKTIWIIAGGHYAPDAARIGPNRVAVPASTWKVAAILDRGIDPARIDSTAGIRLIAVDMPNTRGIIRHDWQRYRVSVDTIESKTGYDFFGRLPERIQSELESQVDTR
jgi:endonuclease G